VRLLPWRKSETVERGGYSAPLGWDQYQQLFTFNNNLYPYGLQTTLRGDRETISDSYAGYGAQAYAANGVVFACMALRQMVFSEARFQFQELRNGRPGNLFGNPDLALLEQPGPNQTTRDLLKQAIVDADLAGNWFGLKDGNQIRRLRPDWVTIVMGSKRDSEEAALQYDAEVLGYLYHPDGDYDREPDIFDVAEVAHFAPLKDPRARFRGMSWLSPIVREITADSAATGHRLKFFENGATSNMVIKMPESIRPETFRQWGEQFRGNYEGMMNAYKTIFLGGGADVEVVGANFQQMDFKVTQGAGETRIAAAARVHPVLVGLSEGLQGSSLNAGNFGAARRSTADMCFRPLWGDIAATLQTIVPPPQTGARLWYDGRDIAFLREDEKDAAEIQQLQATAIKTLVDAGYDTNSVVDAVTADDLSRLQHTGLISVQLQPPPDPNAPPADASSNGSGMPMNVPAPQ